MVDPFLPEADKLAALREALPATAAGIYLDTATCGPLPAEAAAAMRQLEDWELRVGRADEASLDALAERADETRGVLAALLGGAPGQVFLTHSVGEGLAAVLGDMPSDASGGLLTTDQEPASTRSFLAARAGRGASSLATLAAGPEVHDDAFLADLERNLAETARLAVVSHVLPTTGRLMPVAAIAERCRRAGTVLAIDGAQAAGAISLDVPALGAAAYLVPGHAWLLGPEGVAAAWLDPDRWPDGLPGLPGAAAGDFHRPSLVGLARAVGWLEMYVGLPWALERAARLAADIWRGLAEVPGVTVLTPREQRAAIITFRVEGWRGPQLREALGRRAFAICGLVPALDAVRLSVGWFNTDEELEQLLTIISELAAAGPEASGRPPALVLLGESPGREDASS